MLHHTVIETKGNDALLLTNLDAPQPYVIAHNYDPGTGEWSQGSYFADLGKAYREFHPEIIVTTPFEVVTKDSVLSQAKKHELWDSAMENKYWLQSGEARDTEILNKIIENLKEELTSNTDHNESYFKDVIEPAINYALWEFLGM